MDCVNVFLFQFHGMDMKSKCEEDIEKDSIVYRYVSADNINTTWLMSCRIVPPPPQPPPREYMKTVYVPVSLCLDQHLLCYCTS